MNNYFMFIKIYSCKNVYLPNDLELSEFLEFRQISFEGFHKIT
jgi:hypothetical protein